ncbi:hypothetical protein NHH73_25010 [Oxalobacteraceae bacterium OTU3CINTB1]|nr:hypothetical protein NHH73_25010 [Oxalobacteraceae bacterium OTU3CINTB1]
MDNNRELLGVIGATERKREKLTLGWRGATTRLPDVTFVEEQPAPAARAQTAAAPVLRVDPWTKPDPVDLCLELWKNWMAGDSDRDLGAKTMRGLCGEGDAHGVDLHEAQQANDIRIAQATNAVIDSMPRLHVWAIYRACSLASVWRFPNASLVDVAAEARAELATKLRRNICTALLF